MNQETVKRLFDYQDGDLLRRASTSSRAQAGQAAGEDVIPTALLFNLCAVISTQEESNKNEEKE